MRDGQTRRMRRDDSAFAAFLKRNRVTLILCNGDAAGTEYAVSQRTVLIGRGPGVDLAVDSTSLSRQHASLEFERDGFSIRDAGSTNGVLVNGTRTEHAPLKHGDRIELGEQVFQYVLEESETVPTHVIDED